MPALVDPGTNQRSLTRALARARGGKMADARLSFSCPPADDAVAFSPAGGATTPDARRTN